ncbi:MAG TPA: efflux RND transporter periplasmic adaptor subunit [Anaerolineae bacterium]|nr:efflux RND transporter periplasmic adaptor subunit [Anaerolineae bacterium]
MTVKKSLWLRLGLIWLLGTLLLSPIACTVGGGDTPQKEVATPTPIPTSVVPSNPTYTVDRGDVIRKFQFSARIAPVLEEELFFKMNGYVETVYVRRGDVVKAGDLLAELEMTDLKNQITQKQAEMTAVQLNYDRRLAESRASVRAKELNLAKIQASQSDSQLVRARISLEQARIRLSNAQDEYRKSLDRAWEQEDVRKRYAEGVQDAQWNLEIAEAEYNDVLRDRKRTGYDIELAQQDLDLALMAQQEIEIGLDITQTLLSLQRLNDQLKDARIEAPFDGVILQLSVVDGKQVQGYDAVMTLADTTQLEVSADLMDSEMSELTEGMEITAEFVNRPGQEIKGVIRRLPYPYGSTKPADGVTDEDKSARITLTNPEESGYKFSVGDRLRITTELERSENTLRLPPAAVRSFEGRTFVVIQQEGGQRRMDVRLGVKSDDWVEILDGVEEGQVVIAP